MKRLIKKEIIVISKHLLIAIMLPIMGFIVAASDRTTAYSMFILSIVFLSSSTIYYSIKADKKVNADMLFNSFPIDRRESFKSKYVVYAFVPLLYSLIFYISILSLRDLDHPLFFMVERPHLGFDLVILSSSFSIMILAVFIPLLYKKGKGGSAMAVGIAAVYLLGARQGGDVVPTIIFNPFVWVILLGISIVTYLMSLKVLTHRGVGE